ncbi:MAG: RnfABCDGE type electron transport complex subunit B [bacterium]|nr:RnfABCDGE type electron transport complex subunit B [bacterium]
MILFFVAKKFRVDEDPRIDEVAELLPGANCGGCGLPGCRGFAEAVVNAADEGDISALNCPPGGSDTMAAIGKALGMEVGEATPTIAIVKCGGTREKAPVKLEYDGPSKCALSDKLFSGENGCPYGCMGLGDCVSVCNFDAIYIDEKTGLPVVSDEKCVACGACVTACPRHIIEMRPKGRKNRRVWVDCMNQQKGAVGMKNCKAVCIGCAKCAKECPEKIQAITMKNSLAYIDPEKCIACGKCIPVCPKQCISATFTPPKPKPKPEKKAAPKTEKADGAKAEKPAAAKTEKPADTPAKDKKEEVKE